MKIPFETFSELVGELYDSALDAERWPATLANLSSAFKACFAGFGWDDTRIMAVGGSYGALKADSDEANRHLELFKKTLVYSNPMRVPVLLTQNVDDAYTIDGLVTMEEYKRSRYYKDYAKPMGWGDGLSSILSKEGGVVHFIALARKSEDPYFDADDVNALRLLTPHIRRAYTIGNLIGKQKAQVAALAEAFDHLSAAVFLLGAGARVVYLNESARAALASGMPLVVKQGSLGTADGRAQSEFDKAFEATKRRDSNTGPAGSTLVLAATGDKRYIAHFLPLAEADLRNGKAPRQAVAAVFLTLATMETRSPIETISRTYGLTPREASILVALVEIGGTTEVAAQFGLSVSTVKTHVKAIFGKTSVVRQADLVKLVAGYVTPAVSSSVKPS